MKKAAEPVAEKPPDTVPDEGPAPMPAGIPGPEKPPPEDLFEYAISPLESMAAKPAYQLAQMRQQEAAKASEDFGDVVETIINRINKEHGTQFPKTAMRNVNWKHNRIQLGALMGTLDKDGKPKKKPGKDNGKK